MSSAGKQANHTRKRSSSDIVASRAMFVWHLKEYEVGHELLVTSCPSIRSMWIVPRFGYST